MYAVRIPVGGSVLHVTPPSLSHYFLSVNYQIKVFVPETNPKKRGIVKTAGLPRNILPELSLDSVSGKEQAQMLVKNTNYTFRPFNFERF